MDSKSTADAPVTPAPVGGSGLTGRTPRPSRRSKRAGKDQRAARRRRVAELMLQEMTHDEVRDQLELEGMGCSRSVVTRDMQAIRKEWREHRLDNVDEWVAQELLKLRADEGALRAKLREAASPVKYALVYDRVLKVMARRAKLLGLDEPTRIQASVDVEANATATVELVDHDALRALPPQRRREALAAARSAFEAFVGAGALN